MKIWYTHPLLFPKQLFASDNTSSVLFVVFSRSIDLFQPHNRLIHLELLHSCLFFPFYDGTIQALIHTCVPLLFCRHSLRNFLQPSHHSWSTFFPKYSCLHLFTWNVLLKLISLNLHGYPWNVFFLVSWSCQMVQRRAFDYGARSRNKIVACFQHHYWNSLSQGNSYFVALMLERMGVYIGYRITPMCWSLEIWFSNKFFMKLWRSFTFFYSWGNDWMKMYKKRK